LRQRLLEAGAAKAAPARYRCEGRQLGAPAAAETGLHAAHERLAAAIAARVVA